MEITTSFHDASILGAETRSFRHLHVGHLHVGVFFISHARLAVAVLRRKQRCQPVLFRTASQPNHLSVNIFLLRFISPWRIRIKILLKPPIEGVLFFFTAPKLLSILIVPFIPPPDSYLRGHFPVKIFNNLVPKTPLCIFNPTLNYFL